MSPHPGIAASLTGHLSKCQCDVAAEGCVVTAQQFSASPSPWNRWERTAAIDRRSLSRGHSRRFAEWNVSAMRRLEDTVYRASTTKVALAAGWELSRLGMLNSMMFWTCMILV